MNVGEKTVNVETSLRANSTFYHGATAGLVKKQLDSIQLNPGTTETISMQVSAEQYAEKLVEFTILKIICLATIKETNYSWVDEHSFAVDMPEIIIFARDELKVGEEGTVTFRIMNLLNTKLTKCKITFQAPGIGNHETIKCRDIDINEEMDIEHKVKPAISGELVIKAIFTSKELHFMCGSSLIDVDP